MAQPKPVSAFDSASAKSETYLDAAAEAEIDSGLGVSHERVREWLVRLGQGEKVSPPSE